MKNVLLTTTILTLLFSSCRKDDDLNKEIPDQLEPITADKDYIKLSIGNYWVYEHYSIDTLGNENNLSILDSNIIDRDTIINGNTYYILMGTNYPYNHNWGIVHILKDSADYLVNNYGKILFSQKNFTDILQERVQTHNNDTLFTLQYKMETESNSIDVPSGSYHNLLNFKGTINSNHPIYPRYLNNYYAPGIGKILETYLYFSNPTTYEKRLVRFNINN